jgi:hypothetical protein
MRILSVWFLFLCTVVPCLAQTKSATETVKVKIEATELDRLMLLDKLNASGKDHHLKFVPSDADFDYRIAFATGQGTVNTTYGEMNASDATTTVYDPKGTVLFDFKRAGRGTDERATVSVAKEIIKRILKLRAYGVN